MRAWAEGIGQGHSAPVKEGDTDIEVILSAGGGIAGSVRLTSGVSPKGCQLTLYQDDHDFRERDLSPGRIFETSVDDDGEFVFDQVAPGTWLLRVQLAGLHHPDRRWGAGRPRGITRPRVVRVEEGKSTRLDIELGAEKLCHLRGRIRVGDVLRDGFCELVTEGDQALDVSLAGLGKNGRFHLVAREPGTYRLVISAGPGHHDHGTITDLVELKPGRNSWERDFPADRWNPEGIRLDGD